MSYKATVLKVMIASPGDVEKERRIARDVILEWNSINSEDRSIVLMPVGWETHSSPSMNARAQEVINKQVLADCDLLIAILWTRIGTPTGKSISGTVDEINEHIQAGKPAMIYFSSAPAILDSVDSEQYSALEEFREDLKDRGLIERYESLSEFRAKLARQLAQTVIRQFTHLTEEPTIEGAAISYPTSPSISEDARELLISAVQEGNGTILSIRSVAGLSVETGGRQFVEEGNARSEARWLKAIEDLEQLDFIRDRGYKGEFFEVTADGYGAADSLMLES
jgi:hypothetical protein